MIKLRFCSIEFTGSGVRTIFFDGSEVEATPHDTHHYHVIAHRCGYQDDTLGYCEEHEFAHAFVAEKLCGGPSTVLWHLAHDLQPPRGGSLLEEIAAQTFQRWLRANERPILSGADWDQLKRDALELLEPRSMTDG